MSKSKLLRMEKFTLKLSKRSKKLLLSGLVVTFMFGMILYSSKPVHAQQGVAPTVIPAGGCAIDGNLLSRTPTTTPFSPDNGDFLPNDGASGTGGYVFISAGLPVDSTVSFHLIDGYDSTDVNVFTGGSKLSHDPNTWVWKPGKAPGKDDINNALFFFADDSLGNIWFVGSGDRKKTNGNTYLDFELLQNPLYENPDSTFTSLGPDEGRTIGDLLISITYTIGGTNPQLFIYQWDSTAQGDFEYIPVNPAAGTTFLATNSDSAIVVPYGAFGSNTYSAFAFTEVACNLSELLPGSSSCVNINTVIVKSKASQSVNAALKDFVTPVQVNIGSAPVVSVNSPTICIGDSATLSATVLSGSGPYTYLWSTGDTTQAITVSPDTTTQYTITVTGINGCPSSPVTSVVTVTDMPVCFISGPDTICPLEIGQFFGPDSLESYAWTINGAGTILGDTSVQMVEVQGSGACDTSFILNLVVTAAGGCSSTCSMTVFLVDTIPPVITNVPADTGVCCADSIPLPAAVTATDNCEGSVNVILTEAVSDSTGPNMFILTRTWTAMDTCSNTSSDSQVITVNDTLYGSNANFTNINSPEDNIVKYLSVAPNPFNSSAKIQFGIKIDAYVSVDLYNYTGVRLISLYNANVSAGKNISLQLSPDASMGTGMYLLVLRTKYGVETRHIILKR